MMFIDVSEIWDWICIRRRCNLMWILACFKVSLFANSKSWITTNCTCISLIFGWRNVVPGVTTGLIFYYYVVLGFVNRGFFENDQWFLEGDLLTGLLRIAAESTHCLLYTSPSPRDLSTSSMPSFAWKKDFFNDTATTEIYTLHIVGSVRCV